MNDKVIFVHIPKTGGTTINTSMRDVDWGTEVNFNYRHLSGKTYRSNAGDIFDPANAKKYKDYLIFMMLRHPVDRLISEYYFIQHRPSFMDSIKHKPKTFEMYVKAKQTHNGMVSFLKGRRIFSKTYAQENDLDDVLSAIDNIPIHVGIFESFSESLGYFQDVTGIQWDKKMEVKRMTFKRPKAEDISEALRETILKNNQLDLALYNHCLQNFEGIKHNYTSTKIKFDADKYKHVIPFVHSWCLFDFYSHNKQFRKLNNTFLKELNFYLLKNARIVDGRRFTAAWNLSFLKAVEMHFPNSPFLEALQSDFNISDEPLEQLDKLSQSMDVFFNSDSMDRKKYYTPMRFDESQVVVPPKANKSGIGGFVKNLFGRG